MNNSYDELIEKLRNQSPKPVSPEKLTHSIMHNLPSKTAQRKFYLTVNVSDKQWSVINGFRIILSTAAAILIGLMIFEQWETNKKLETLQEIVASNPQKINYNEYTNKEMEQIFKQLKITNASYMEKNPKIDQLLIERKSLHFLMEQIRKLQKENESFRDELKKKYESKNPEK